jgi:hypothetical protein
MRCLSPADVYLSLKASDFIQHDINAESAFEGISDAEPSEQVFEVELSLRKWYSFDRSRELRCFVREGILIGSSWHQMICILSLIASGISQREMIHYDFWTLSIRQSVASVVRSFWEKEIRDKWGPNNSCKMLHVRNLNSQSLTRYLRYPPHPRLTKGAYCRFQSFRVKD